MDDLIWRKSSFSGSGNGNCIQLASLSDTRVGVRDSKHPEAEYLTFTRTELAVWLAGLRWGDLDDVVSGPKASEAVRRCLVDQGGPPRPA